MATSLRDFFGFILKDKDSKQLPKSIVSPNTGDGSVVIDSTVNGVVGDSYLLAFDPEGQIKNEIDLIRRYRELSRFPEVSEAIEDIINESIITDDSGKVVSLNLDELKLSEGLKKKIIDSFNEILIKLDFYTNGHEIFKNWYIDGKLLYQIILDEMDIKKGIHELRYIDPRKIKKIKNIKKETVSPGIEIIKDIDEYYLYNDKGISNTQQAGVKLSKDSVVYCHSGIIDPNNGMVQSYLHKAIKPANQLKMLEESVVIYRYTRAPERRVFYIDVGNLPKGKAEQYVNDMMNKFKNKLSYDAVTGDLVDSKRHLCLDMNTKVPLLDGRTLTISEISAEMQSVGTQLWAYSCDPITGKFAPGKITWAGVSRPNAQVMRITLDNGETITCTPDHKFPVWNKGFVKAEDLCAGESMVPHYTRQKPIAKGAKKNYEQIFENETGKWQYTHRAVSNWKDAFGAANGYNGFKHLRESLTFKNHKIAKIEWLNERIDTGCLTIDGNEEFHNFHTFALSAGIYTQNQMMEDFWLPRRDNGKSTEITTLPGGCLQMDTSVSLLDGRELSIRDIESELNAGKELWTYSCDEFTGEIKPGLISWAGVTHASAKVIKLTLDNGETITCTPDHKFPVYDRGFVRADELTIDQSMIPLYRKKEQISKHKKLDYEQIFDNASKKWKYTHRMVHQFVELEEFIYKNAGDFSVTHHKNHNRFDNSPDNLVRMSWEDHAIYHADTGFSEDAQKLGTIAAAAKLAYIKENDPEQYSKCIEAMSNRWSSWWTNMSEEEYRCFCKKVSAGINNYFTNLSPDQRETRAETSRKNMRKATDAFSLKSKTDAEFRENLNMKLRAAWSEEARNAQQEKSKKINAAEWGDATKSDRRRLAHKELQKFEYDRSILVEIINLVKGKTTHQITLKDVVRLLNENQQLLQLLLSLHENKRIPMWKPEYGFTDGYVTSLVRHFEYESWGDFRKKESLYNHKIVNIEWLEDEIEVGTLTIDGYEIIHGHHTFALSAGIFTKNSGMSQLDDLDYFLNKLYHSLNVPVSRMKPETGFSIGRSDTISRDEIKFGKFVEKLRTKFNSLFMDLLRVQLVSKGICTVADWDGLKDKIRIIYAEDNHFSELKENEILNTRLSSLSQMDAYVGKYVSREWVQKNILKFTEEEISELNKQIKAEGPSPEELAVQQAGDQAGPPQ